MKLPDGFSTVNSYIFADKPEPYLNFLVKGLGGKELSRTMYEGRGANAQIKIGESIVMLSESSDNFPATHSFFYLYVEDADATYKQALQHGAEGLMAPLDMPYGDRQGMFKDFEGNIWAPSTRFDDSKFQ